MTNPKLWASSNDYKYRYISFSHQPARFDNPVVGDPYWPRITSNNINVSVFKELEQLSGLYRTATLIRVTYDVYPPTNWRFDNQSQTDTQVVGDAQAPTGYISNTFSSRVHPMSVRFFQCMLHEYPNGTISDGQDRQTVTPVNMLGLNALPDLFHPDRLNTLDGSTRGQEVFEKLFEDRRIKILQGMRRRKFVWRPRTRFDKMYTTFDLDRIQGAADTSGSTDDDQRCGACWFAIDFSNYSSQIAGQNLSVSEIDALPFMVRVRFAFKCTGRT